MGYKVELHKYDLSELYVTPKMWHFCIFLKVNNIIMGIQIFLGKPPSHIEQVIIKRRIALKEPLCFTAVDTGATISFNKTGSPDEASIVTSVDKQNWMPYTFNTVITLANIGDKVYFRAADENDISFYKDDSNYYRFATTAGKKIAASGNTQTLMKADGVRLDISRKSYCYSNIFAGCTSLTTAPELPATTLADSCYQYMFYGCSSLITAPSLPATTLSDFCYANMFEKCSSLITAPKLPVKTLAFACYQCMFSGCSSLTVAPELPATTLAQQCYYEMFYGCSSLTTTPLLPATTLSDFCYANMFEKCSSLTTAPALPVITLAGSCYQCMFSGCSSLTVAPELPATTLTIACYNSMFNGCSSLTVAPELPATTLVSGCYSHMFSGCNNLASINVSFSNWSPSSATTGWVNGVAKSGTFTCPAALPNNQGINYIPIGWTRIEK